MFDNEREKESYYIELMLRRMSSVVTEYLFLQIDLISPALSTLHFILLCICLFMFATMLVIIVLPLFLVYSYHVGYYGFASFPCIQLPRFHLQIGIYVI